MSVFYFDNNATTRVLPPVLEAMLPWFSEQYGNASSHHQLGQAAKSALMAARAATAALIGASPAEIVFTSGATESNHSAILSALSGNPTRRRIVTSGVEHPSTLRLLGDLATRGFDVVELPVLTSGELDMAAFTQAVTADTALVTLMHANNETGVIFPIAEAAAIAHAKGALFHTDAAQSVGRIPLDVRQLDCDLLSFSGHKLHAAKGVGALYIRKNLAFSPLLHGHQERNRRGGTENQESIVGLGVACQLAHAAVATYGTQVGALRDRLEQRITSALPFTSVNGTALRIPNTSSLCFEGLHGEELLHRLDQARVMVSRGSACTAGGTDPSHVLLAMGLSRDEALSTVRFSLSRETTEAEVDMVVETVIAVAKTMHTTNRMVA